MANHLPPPERVRRLSAGAGPNTVVNPSAFQPMIHSSVCLKIYNQMCPSQKYKEAMFVQSSVKNRSKGRKSKEQK